ncbi:MAG: radical SAM family heme chaperone HemW [Chitinophagales bacterium]|nr:radical SAM family heme chaperone HemW [Chitinophagales bacterium]
MAGIYVHIPYCKQACSYCNFYFSTQLQNTNDLVDALVKEIDLQANFFEPNTQISSIYFGGGTPSILDTADIIKVLNKIYNTFNVDDFPEITLEANPDDLNSQYLKDLKAYTPINRLSIGIQSFFEDDLKYMNRAHTTQQAYDSITLAQQQQFDNITCDLIYGTPTLSDKNWEKNLLTLIEFGIKHLSCYALTVEEKTALHYQIEHHKVANVDEEKMATHFRILQAITKMHGYTQYEISNFCTDKNYAIHNSNYWNRKPYLGIGPSAHSYNGKSRFWNINNNIKYINSINSNNIPNEQETLTNIEQYNEFVLTGMRTKWGVQSARIEKLFGNELRRYFEFEVSPFIGNAWVNANNGTYILTDEGKLFCDFITEQLFWVEESV